MERSNEVLLVVCFVVILLVALGRVLLTYDRLRVAPERFMRTVREVEREEARSPLDRDRTVLIVRRRMVIGSVISSGLVLVLWVIWLIAHLNETGGGDSYVVAPAVGWLTVLCAGYVTFSLIVKFVQHQWGWMKWAE